ncbi:MAG: B12-binding domain-containing radical SAM protein [Oscillospiraceae bacterium]|nr:B12-binding domain-containing radical SAM protein [Oscillospiraceae bacterium]
MRDGVRTVILAINAKYVHSSLAAWVIAGGVRKHARMRHGIQVAQANINQSIDAIAAQVTEHSPDVVGVSSYIWNAHLLPGLLRLLREKLPRAVTVLGGPEASHNAGFWLSYADYIICGEGEKSFPALLDELACGNPFTQRIIPEEQPTDDFIDPYSAEYFAAQQNRIEYIETSRGCPYRCAFCLSGGSKLRFFPVDAAKDQIVRLARQGAQTIKFVDRTFNCNPERAYELFEFCIGLKTDCRFHFEVAPDLFDARTISLLREAPPGRIQLEAGLQSFYSPALEASSRQTDLAAAQRNIRELLERKNIHIHVDLIAGLPYERLADFKNSFDRAYALGAHTLQLGFLKMLHGSEMRKREKSIVYAENPPYEIISSPWMSAGDLKILKTAERALQHTHNKGRFLSAVGYAQKASGMRPFEFYHSLGENTQSYAAPLEDYAWQIYSHLIKLNGVDAKILLGHMICDWMGMVKGKNMPKFMRIQGERAKHTAQEAKKLLGRCVERQEACLLPSGGGVFVDSQTRDPVTGLYRIYFISG